MIKWLKNVLIVSGDSLFNELKNKTEICPAIRRSSFLEVL
jgi:hypothetical protein